MISGLSSISIFEILSFKPSFRFFMRLACNWSKGTSSVRRSMMSLRSLCSSFNCASLASSTRLWVCSALKKCLSSPISGMVAKDSCSWKGGLLPQFPRGVIQNSPQSKIKFPQIRVFYLIRPPIITISTWQDDENRFTIKSGEIRSYEKKRLI
jgi:hypothetical protein